MVAQGRVTSGDGLTWADLTFFLEIRNQKYPLITLGWREGRKEREESMMIYMLFFFFWLEKLGEKLGENQAS